jgi:hypothetical protein
VRGEERDEGGRGASRFYGFVSPEAAWRHVSKQFALAFVGCKDGEIWGLE